MVRVWGRGVVRLPQHPLGTDMLYKVVLDRVAGVVEAVHLYILLVSKSWNSQKMVMESHGKVIEFHLRMSVGTLKIRPYKIQNGRLSAIIHFHMADIW